MSFVVVERAGIVAIGAICGALQRPACHRVRSSERMLGQLAEHPFGEGA